MRQIAAGLINYINDNRGILPPAMISDNYGKTTDATNPYKDGWFWASELMNQHYVAAPNVLAGVQSTTIGKSPGEHYQDSSVFQCPSASTPSEATPGLGTSGGTIGSVPTDNKNNVGVYGTAVNLRGDGAPAYATATWYQLCAVTSIAPTAAGADPEYFPGGSATAGGQPPTAPFIFFDITNEYSAGYATEIGLGGFRRNLSLIRHSALMAMVVESGSLNWLLNGNSGNGQPIIGTTPINGEIPGMPALAARHGQVSRNGNNAYTNIAFFDGHVELLPTQPFEDYSTDGNPPTKSTGGATNIPQSLGTVFTLTQDQ